MLKENHFVLNPPSNRLIGELPKIGIRPVIDGRRHGIRESLESPTLAMAEQVAKLLTSNLQSSAGQMSMNIC